MRFHFGISKRVKIKTIITFLGALFLLVLGTLGLDRVNADTFDFDVNDGFNGAYSYAMTNSVDTDIVVSPANAYYYQISFDSGQTLKKVLSFTPYGTSFTSSYSFGYFWNKNTYNYQGNAMRVLKSMNLRFQNNDFCDVSSYKSNTISLNLRLGTDIAFETMMALNNYTFDDIADVNIAAIDSNNDWFSTDCTYNSIYKKNSQNFFVSYTCPNVYIGTSSHEILTYSVDVFNKLQQSDTLQYNSNYYWLLTDVQVNFTDTSYTCSSDNPQIDFSTADLPTSADLDNFLEDAREHFNNNMSGFDTSNVFLQYPESFTDVLLIPYNLISSLVSASNICTPLTIDFSSFTNSFGANDYVLTFPCMRSTLSNLLTSDFYNLLDLLLCFYLTYQFLTLMVLYIEELTNGGDLFNLLFKGERSSIYEYSKKE